MATTPSPALVAASPYLKQAIADLKACVNTILTGDPAQIGLRVGPAVSIFVNQLVLLERGVLTAEVGVVQTDINNGLDSLSAKLP